jgi:hypothetical protein
VKKEKETSAFRLAFIAFLSLFYIYRLVVVGTQASPFYRVEHEMSKSIDRVSFSGLNISVDYFIFNCLPFNAYQCFVKKIEKILYSNKYFFSLA